MIACTKDMIACAGDVIARTGRMITRTSDVIVGTSGLIVRTIGLIVRTHGLIVRTRGAIARTNGVIACESRLIACERRLIPCERRVIRCESRVITCERRVMTCVTRLISCVSHVIACERRLTVMKCQMTGCESRWFATDRPRRESLAARTRSQTPTAGLYNCGSMPRGRIRRLVATLLATLIATVIASAPLAADHPWTEIRGADVVVFGQQSPRTLRDVAVQIEQFRAVVGQLIVGARQPQSLPTEVYLFDTERAMREYLPLYQGKPASLTGYCHCGAPDEISVIVAALSQYHESSSIIYHEYTHLLLRNAIRDVPVWLNEGLAEYFSTFTLSSNGRQAEVGAAIPSHLAALQEAFIPLAQLLTVDRNSPLYNERTRKTIFYAEAWALTRYLLAGRPGGVETVSAFLAEYAANGADSAAALVKATGLPLSTIERDVRSFVNQQLVGLDSPTAFGWTNLALSERVEVDAPSASRTLAPAESEARLGEIQLRIGREQEAAKRIEGAAAAGQGNAQAQLVLARLRLRQQRNGDAMPLLQKAAALAPDDFAAQYLYGLTLLRGDGDLSDASWPTDRARAAREALWRAVRLRPGSAAAQAWLGYADQQEGTQLAEAKEATAKAVTLAPGRLDYALQLAEIESQLGNAVEARRLLAPLARADDESIAHRASQLLAVLNRPQAPVTPTLELVPRETLDLRRANYRLREPRAGEQRVFGELLEIACGASGVRFRLRVDGQEIAAPAKRMEEVELTSFAATGQTVVCGPRVPADKVFLTRAADGTTVAVEFMPRDYVP